MRDFFCTRVDPTYVRGLKQATLRVLLERSECIHQFYNCQPHNRYSTIRIIDTHSLTMRRTNGATGSAHHQLQCLVRPESGCYNAAVANTLVLCDHKRMSVRERETYVLYREKEKREREKERDQKNVRRSRRRRGRRSSFVVVVVEGSFRRNETKRSETQTNVTH